MGNTSGQTDPIITDECVMRGRGGVEGGRMERQTQREVETETETWWVSQVGDDRKSSYTDDSAGSCRLYSLCACEDLTPLRLQRSSVW